LGGLVLCLGGLAHQSLPVVTELDSPQTGYAQRTLIY